MGGPFVISYPLLMQFHERQLERKLELTRALEGTMTEVKKTLVRGTYQCTDDDWVLRRTVRWLDPDTGEAFDENCVRQWTFKARTPYGVWYDGSKYFKVDEPGASAPPDLLVNPKTAQGNKKYSLRHLPLPAEVEVNRALADGLVKYGAANWREKGVPATVYIDAAMRHIKQWYDGGQERASDSDVHNLGHAMACLAIIIDAQWNGTLGDDRPMPCRDTDALLKRGEV